MHRFWTIIPKTKFVRGIPYLRAIALDIVLLTSELQLLSVNYEYDRIYLHFHGFP